ncbi:hypothetical protein [Natrinema sp. SYSU A 869]|uniref:hypothetical protein n=1 Tax=Natrinema sp. SYSU A 869 TaxID=2871694 RepID=UPI001CA43C37|nr:hypothetical protein [Natrinema sp. SYSU A 869]
MERNEVLDWRTVTAGNREHSEPLREPVRGRRELVSDCSEDHCVFRWMSERT